MTTEKIIINSQLAEASSYNIDRDGSDTYIYEVIRVIEGRLLFAEEHYNRLARSLAFIRKEMNFSFDDMLRDAHALIAANGLGNDNIKLIVDNFREDGAYDVILMLFHASYPTEEDYRRGVTTALYNAVRLQPQLKIRDKSLRDATDKILKNSDLFELILVDNDNDITEGSRSNIFFIRDCRIYTSPAEDVLLGVTRMKIIEICRENGYEVIEQYINADSVGDYDSAFLSGTSPKVLPIRSIGDLKMDVNNSTLRHIMTLFNEAIERSLAE